MEPKNLKMIAWKIEKDGIFFNCINEENMETVYFLVPYKAIDKLFNEIKLWETD